MATTNTSCKVLIPSTRFVHKIKMTIGLAVCKNYLNDDIIYTTLKDCNLDQNETCRRLKMIRDVREVSKCSVDEAYTMLKQCNMDQTETCRMLKMIDDVREVASKYSVDDVYTMLKECNMDLSEATQRLLYIDTFEVVKKKKDTQKSVISGKSDNQWRAASRRNFHSSKVFNDASGGRNLSSGGVTNNVKRAIRPLPVDSRKESNVGRMANLSSGAVTNNVKRAIRPLPVDSRKESNVGCMANLSSGGVTNNVKRAIRPLPVDSRKESNVGRMATSAANVNGTQATSNGSHSHKVAPKLSSDVKSSTSDPKAVSYQNTKYTCYVGSIKC